MAGLRARAAAPVAAALFASVVVVVAVVFVAPAAATLDALRYAASVRDDSLQSFDPVWIVARAPDANASAPAVTSYYNKAINNSAILHGNVSVHVATLENPVGHWHVYCPGCDGPNSCTGNRTVVSTQAEEHGCAIATNGGPFGMHTPDCIGPMVSDGVVAHNATSGRFVCVGLTGPVTNTSSGAPLWFFGEVHSGNADSVLATVENLLCGFDWLVYNGTAAVAKEGGLIAPRTFVGLDASGALVEAVVDGSEVARTGMTDYEAARWAAAELGLVYAVNLDGGGSSTMVVEALGGVQGCPTAIDLPICMERTVVTITCIK